MSIEVKIATDITREGVLIDPRKSAADKVIKDVHGKIVSVEQDGNIISRGLTGRSAAKALYGKI